MKKQKILKKIILFTFLGFFFQSTSLFALDTLPLEGFHGFSLKQKRLFTRWKLSLETQNVSTKNSKKIRWVLKDPQHKISSIFHIPRLLKKRVGFWMKLFTYYTSSEVLLVDQQNPELIYEVISFRKIKYQAASLSEYKRIRKSVLETTLKTYQMAFQKLLKKPALLFISKDPIFKNIQKVYRKFRRTQRNKPPLEIFALLRKQLIYQAGLRDKLVKALYKAEPYFPKMEPIFSSLQIPPEITRLCLLESAFNWYAVSKAGATGLWQFLKSTGKAFLKIHLPYLDERLSPIKSTIAAAKLLAQNKSRLPHWALAITAYNYGITRLRKLPASLQKKENLSKLLMPQHPQPHLGWAGRNYYLSFLAILYTEKYKKVFFHLPPTLKQNPFEFAQLSQPISLLKLSQKLNIPLFQLLKLNPDIRDFHFRLPKGFHIALPHSFLAQINRFSPEFAFLKFPTKKHLLAQRSLSQK